MTAVQQSPWWGELLERLVDTALADLSAEYGVDLEAAEQALVESATKGPVTEEPWWPEAVRRILDGGSLRETARRFGTKPRRIRRGLARAGVRVGGQTVGNEGIVELQAYRARLGKEPDSDIAAEAGVTVEAVQGERRRLGIDPFRPAPSAADYAEDTPPLADRPPEPSEPPPADPPRKPKRRWEVNEPQVIRRPSSARMGTLGRNRRRGWGLERAGEDERDAEGGLGSASSRNRGPTGRRRIVRPDPKREPEEVVTKAGPRRRSEPVHGKVRVVSADDVDLSELDKALQSDGGDSEQPTIADQLPRLSGAPKVDEAPAPAIEEPSEDVPAQPEEAPVEAKTEVQADEPAPTPPAPEEPVPSEPVEAPASEAQQVALFEETAPAGRPPEEVAPVTPPEPERIVPTARVGWRVSIDGEVQPFLVVAHRMDDAVRIVQKRIASRDLVRASIWEVGPILGVATDAQ